MQKGETKEEEKEEEALLDILNWVTVMEEAMAKAITEAKEWHCVDKDLFESSMRDN